MASTAPRSILVDTNILLLIVVGRTSPEIIKRFKRTETYDTKALELAVQIVSRFSGILTTANILTEVSNLLSKGLDIASRYAVWETFRALVPYLEERTISSGRLSRHAEFARLGLTDVGVTTLGHRGWPVLTDDLDLALVLKARGVFVQNLNHLRFPSVAD